MTEPVAISETERLISSDKVEGTRVYNRQGERLGSIRNFMVNKRSGRVEYAVMEFGGILGVGNEYYPLPWELLAYDEQQGGYCVDLDKSRLEGAPRYRDRDPLWDEIYGQQVYGYYGMTYPLF
ncbi:PRC-barrel domain-containing protein [Novosphingobium sp. 9U]|uniref:PRC-barrel domain-containing protein n=1 Tax=Novosphingobium sp. 9U TaxID=2653158 RepID=UPI0012F3CB32|nr:PRC-barrel domain-containing protein [Novosphingobium sp. 9U]VWX51221.1 Photosystem reaction center subunit H [Novosphingobium sp. 9U]